MTSPAHRNLARLVALGWRSRLVLVTCGGSPHGRAGAGDGRRRAAGWRRWPTAGRARRHRVARASSASTPAARAGARHQAGRLRAAARAPPGRRSCDKLVSGDVVKVTVVIPEGWTTPQIAARIAARRGRPGGLACARACWPTPPLAASLGVPGPDAGGVSLPRHLRLPAGDVGAGDGAPDDGSATSAAWTPELRARADSLGPERARGGDARLHRGEGGEAVERSATPSPRSTATDCASGCRCRPTRRCSTPSASTRARLLYAQIEDVADNPYNTYTPRRPAARADRLAERGRDRTRCSTRRTWTTSTSSRAPTAATSSPARWRSTTPPSGASAAARCARRHPAERGR